MEKRDLDRTRKLLRVKLKNFQPPVQGACLDVSSTGMKIRMRSKRYLDTSKLLDIEVYGKEATYHIKGEVCWTKRTVLECVIGVHFIDVPSLFLSDVLHMAPGSQSVPYVIDISDNGNSSAEFFANLKFGGMVIPNAVGVNGNHAPPPLHEVVYIQVVQAPHKPQIKFAGVVVAHLPNGIGLRIDDFLELYAELTKI